MTSLDRIQTYHTTLSRYPDPEAFYQRQSIRLIVPGYFFNICTGLLIGFFFLGVSVVHAGQPNQFILAKNQAQLAFRLVTAEEKADTPNILSAQPGDEAPVSLPNSPKPSQPKQQKQGTDQLLEKKKAAHPSLLSEQQEAEHQHRKAIQQQLLTQHIKAEIIRQQKALIVAANEKVLQTQKLRQAETQGKQRLAIIILMLLLLIVSITLFVHSHRARKKLAIQHRFIQEQNREIADKNIHITRQNENLTRKQQEILLQSQWLVKQNEEFAEAQLIIARQNEQMKLYMESLEQQVEQRTHQLTALNQELVKNNQQLEQFGYIVAHNLRGPVARLLGLNQLLQLPANQQQDKELAISKIQHEVRSLDGVISDLNIILQIKKGIETEVETISLAQKLEAVLTTIREDVTESGIEITSDFSRANEVIFIQPYLHSIFYNLISNAIKYRSPDRRPCIKITTTRHDEQTICLMIKDNGIGMDLTRHGSSVFGLYKRFHSHIEGKGIGLYLVKTQMELLGGKIAIESCPGEGTTFYLYFKSLTKEPVCPSVLVS
jgi:signal transduction histidine kinase